MSIVLGDENCQEYLENIRFIPNSCMFCGEEPVIWSKREEIELKKVGGIKLKGQLQCSCGSSGPIRDVLISDSPFRKKTDDDYRKDLVLLLVKEWNEVHNETFLDQLLENLAYG